MRRQEANGVFEWPKGSQGGEKEWGCVNWNHILFSKCSEVITSRFLSCSPPIPFLTLYPLIPPLLPRTFQQVWIRNDIPGNGTEEKRRGQTSVRERKKLYIFSQNGDSGKSSSCFLLLSVWMLPLKARQQVFLWSGRVNKATWIWMRKQSWTHTRLLLTPLSGRRWGIHVWKRKTAEGGGIYT